MPAARPGGASGRPRAKAVDTAGVCPVGRALGGAMVVTVLMAVYRPPLEMLDQAMRSVLAQTLRDIELLVIDDGSEDSELTVKLAAYARSDSRVVIARESHRGLTGSLNRGIQLARGSLIARHDADDWSEPT